MHELDQHVVKRKIIDLVFRISQRIDDIQNINDNRQDDVQREEIVSILIFKIFMNEENIWSNHQDDRPNSSKPCHLLNPFSSLFFPKR